jgi:hypothetical protein
VSGGECIVIVESMDWGEVTLVAADGSWVEVVPTLRLPRPVRVGTRLRVPLGDAGRPQWPLATLIGLAGYPELEAARRTAGLRR